VKVSTLSAEFSEAVVAVKANHFTVNGSSTTKVHGSGCAPYVFIGFETPSVGTVNVILLLEILLI
jgi:hypothetical protein